MSSLFIYRGSRCRPPKMHVTKVGMVAFYKIYMRTFSVFVKNCDLMVFSTVIDKYLQLLEYHLLSLSKLQVITLT